MKIVQLLDIEIYVTQSGRRPFIEVITMGNKSINYQDYLIESLRDAEEAAGYLNAALEGGDIKVFLVALHNVVKAQGGVKKLAEKTHKGRTSLYKSLSADGNPYLKNTNEILAAMGMHLLVVADK